MTSTPAMPRPVARLCWLAGGLLCVAVGGVGVVVPGLPSTVFFIGAAACFTRSSPRLEQWVLGLPGIGQMVKDHRAGLGMPRRAKVIATTSIVAFSTLGILLAPHVLVALAVAVAAAIGVHVVLVRVPTRE